MRIRPTCALLSLWPRFCFFGTSIRTHALKFVRADIYFMPLMIESFVAWPPELLREAAKHSDAGNHVFHVTSTARIAEILSVLDLSALRPERGDYREDTRQVIDFFDRGGNRTSYRANRRFLCDLKKYGAARGRCSILKVLRNFQTVAKLPLRHFFGIRHSNFVISQRTNGSRDQQDDDGERDKNLDHCQNLRPSRE